MITTAVIMAGLGVLVGALFGAMGLLFTSFVAVTVLLKTSPLPTVLVSLGVFQLAALAVMFVRHRRRTDHKDP